MEQVLINDSTLTALGDVIRSKNGKKKYDYKEFNVEPMAIKTFSLSSYEGFTADNIIEVDYKDDLLRTLEFSIILDGITTKVSRIYPTLDTVKDIFAEVLNASAEDKKLSISTIAFELTIKTNYGNDNIYTPIDMVEQVNGFSTIPDYYFTLSGENQYAFRGSRNKFLIDNYGDKFTTNNISSGQYLFYECQNEEVPFEINFNIATANISIASMFEGSVIKKAPKMNNGHIQLVGKMFYGSKIVEINDDFCENLDFTPLHSTAGNGASVFQNCYRLRHISPLLLKELYSNGTTTSATTYSAFADCYTLDEILELAVPIITISSSTAFTKTVDNCYRLKRFTFGTDDGVAKSARIKGATLSLNTIGFAAQGSRITDNGLTTNTQVTDDASYQALKDNPDWWTTNAAYSRYNKTSAIETINSLPDTSAFGTNTIKFRGGAGSSTDGGAINTMTAEEIAVATSKGWTVSFA